MADNSNTSRPVEVPLNYADGARRSHLVAIHDARSLPGQLSLDRHGFELRRHQTAVSNFYDVAEVRAIYYPEVEQLLKNGYRCDPGAGVRT